MPRLRLLVDLSNTHVIRGVQRPYPALLGARLDDLVWAVAGVVAGRWPGEFWELDFRLYDGWHDELGRSTPRYDMLRAYARDNYPSRQKNQRCFVTLASEPAAVPKEKLLDTSRIVLGLPSAAVEFPHVPPEGCQWPSDCSVDVLRSWLRGSCPDPRGCRVQTHAIAFHHQQKLVDTAIVSDAIWYASRGDGIAIVTADEDVVPGLLTARALGSPVIWICRSSAVRPPYAGPLARCGVEFLSCPI